MDKARRVQCNAVLRMTCRDQAAQLVVGDQSPGGLDARSILSRLTAKSGARRPAPNADAALLVVDVLAKITQWLVVAADTRGRLVAEAAPPANAIERACIGAGRMPATEHGRP